MLEGITANVLTFASYHGVIPDVLWPLIKHQAQRDHIMPVFEYSVIRVVEQFRNNPLMDYSGVSDLIDKLATNPDKLYFVEEGDSLLQDWHWVRYRGIATMDPACKEPVPADIYLNTWDPSRVKLRLVTEGGDQHLERIHVYTPVPGMPGLYY